MSVIKEVKYLKQMNFDNLPHQALCLFESSELYREYVINLDYITASYNNIMQVSSSEERALIKKELIKIKAEIARGENDLNWYSPNISL